MDGQSIAVIVIVAVAVIFMARKVFISARKGQCSCGCGDGKQQACCKGCSIACFRNKKQRPPLPREGGLFL